MAWVPARDVTYRKFVKRIFWLKDVIVEPTGSGSGSGMQNGQYGVGLDNLNDLLNIQVNIESPNNSFYSLPDTAYNGLYVFKANGRYGTGWYRSYNGNDEYFVITIYNGKFVHYFGSSIIFATMRSDYSEIFNLYDLTPNDWQHYGNSLIQFTYTISILL